MRYDARHDIQQFVQPRIQVGPMFGQNQGPRTFGPAYFGGLERYLGGLGQSSVEDGYADEEEVEVSLYGFGQLEDDKTSASLVAVAEVNRVRAQLREAGRGDLVEAVNSTATLFQTRLGAALNSAEIADLRAWLSQKLIGFLDQARAGRASSEDTPEATAPRPSASPSVPYTEPPSKDNSTTFMVLGGIALAAVGIYLLRMPG